MTRIRDLGYSPGVLPTGPQKTIKYNDELHVSQVTVSTAADLKPGVTATKGVTVVSPRPPHEFYKPCRAGTFCFNGNGEFTGARQIADWGFTNTSIAFTNSFSLGSVFDASWDWVLKQQKQLGWDWDASGKHYGTPLVGETCDWIINEDVSATRVDNADIKECFDNLKCREDGAEVQEGQKGGGAGMTCHQFAGGTGTSSRVIDKGTGDGEGYTVAALIQSNYGIREHLVIGGVPVGRILKTGSAVKSSSGGGGRTKDGSIVVLVVTDAPLTTAQLDRMARHVTVGLSLVGSHSVGRNSSGDIFVALSTAPHGPETLEDEGRGITPSSISSYTTESIANASMNVFFVACAEAVEEAILNSMVGASSGTVGMDGTQIEGLPTEKVKDLLEKHLVKT